MSPGMSFTSLCLMSAYSFGCTCALCVDCLALVWWSVTIVCIKSGRWNSIVCLNFHGCKWVLALHKKCRGLSLTVILERLIATNCGQQTTQSNLSGLRSHNVSLWRRSSRKAFHLFGFGRHPKRHSICQRVWELSVEKVLMKRRSLSVLLLGKPKQGSHPSVSKLYDV